MDSSALLVFSVTAPVQQWKWKRGLVWKKSEKRKSLEKRRVRKPVKITVKSLKKDFGPGLEVSN